MDQHTGFIVAAFAITFVVLAGTVAAVLMDYRAQLRALARLAVVDGRRAQDATTARDDGP